LPISEAFPGKKPSTAPAQIAPIDSPTTSPPATVGEGAPVAPAAAGSGP
jgi:hypothetical protein